MTIVIIGAGAAGFFSAIQHKERFPETKVVLIEKSSKVLSKVKISGGGRCNVTHACFDPKTMVQHYPRGSKALLSAFYHFQPQDTVAWFETNGVPLKTEADGRMFPQSNSSQSIVDCLQNCADDLGVKLWTSCTVLDIKKQDSGFILHLADGQEISCDKLVLATGSSPKGYDFASSLGHTITPRVPSLFTFTIHDKRLHELRGLSVKRVRAWIHKKQAQEGPLLMTHWGLSGPAIIKLSAWHAPELFKAKYQMPVFVNFLPDLSFSDVEQSLNQYRSTNAKKLMKSKSPFSEIPERLWAYLLHLVGLSDEQQWLNISKRQFQNLLETLTSIRFEINGKGQFKEEFVTCGGVSLDEINFKNMESKICPNLHIIGELLDIDGVTGGFNFQNAWTTAYLSAQ